jgi:O-antigen/teichoic acid export membrane protein
VTDTATNGAAGPGTTSNLHGRLIRGLGASALGPVVTIIIQFISVPVFLHYWGAKLYGEWLILSAIPSYLALSDVGFGNVAASDMTMSVAAGQREAALDTFQSTWLLISVVSVVLLTLVCVAAWFVPWQLWMKLSVISNHGAALIIVVFSAYSLISLQTGVLDSAFRCDGNFAFGTTCFSVFRLAEVAIAMIPVVCGGRPLHVAITYLVARIVGSAVVILILRRKSPWIRFGTTHANFASIRRLASPAFAFMAFPIGNALSLQGLTVLIGGTLGPVAVVCFSTMRTLSRVGFQVLAVIARALWPELSAAFGAGNISLARNLHRRACQVAFTLSLACSVVLAVIGPRVYGSWTRHAVSFDPLTFNLLLLVVLANSFWGTSSVVPMASNQHEKIAVGYIIGTSLSLALAWALLKPFGTAGAAIALLVIDCSMVWLVLRVALRQLSDEPGPFARSMLSMPNFGFLFQLAKGRRV